MTSLRQLITALTALFSRTRRRMTFNAPSWPVYDLLPMGNVTKADASCRTPTTQAKRGDIQGLRTVAIFAVLLFHIWPEKYRNGFLGVDVFFVISGFIMAMILCREPLSLPAVKNFYVSRVRRIVPMCVFVISLTLAAALYLIMDADIRELENDALPAALFYSNVEEMRRKTNYFSRVAEFRFLLHTWSLAVEMQYYLVVPAIFAILTRIPPRLAMLTCLTALIASFLYQRESPAEVAFGHLLSRIWQFMAGTLAYLLPNSFGRWQSSPKSASVEETESLLEDTGTEDRFLDDSKSVRDHAPYKACAKRLLTFILSSLLLLALVHTTVRANAISERYQRPLVVLLTSAIIVVGAVHENRLLRNPLMVWIGDISYTVYLVHWPVILFRRYWSIEKTFTDNEGVVLIGITFLLAVALDAYVDSHFRGLKSVRQVLVAVASVYALFTVAYLLLPTRYDRNASLTKETRANYLQLIDLLNDNTKDKAIAAMLSRETKIGLNNYLTQLSTEMFQCPDAHPYWQEKLNTTWLGDMWECKFLGTGKKRALIIGNSHARQLMDGIAKAFKDVYAELYMYTITWCAPLKELYGGPDKRCDGYADSLPIAVKMYTPDLLFIVNRDWHINAGISQPIQQDRQFRAMQNFVDSLRSNSKHIFIGYPNPEYSYYIGPMVARRLWLRLPLDKIEQRLSEHMPWAENTRKRMNSLNCTQCRFIDFTEIFCDTQADKCYPYDRASQIALLFDGQHLNTMGALRMAPLLRSLYNETS